MDMISLKLKKNMPAWSACLVDSYQHLPEINEMKTVEVKKW